MANSVDRIEIVPTGGPLGAEVRGVDFTQPVDAAFAQALNDAWAAHQVLLFRDQHITPAQHVAATGVFGKPVAGANRRNSPTQNPRTESRECFSLTD